MGPITEQMKKRADRAPGRHQVRHHLDDARRVSRSPRDARHLDRTSRRSSAPRRFARNEIGLANRPPTRRRARADARARPPRDGRGRDGPDLRADLHAGRCSRRPTSSSSWRRSRRQSGGMYISHMRSEGNRLLEAIDEVLTIARDAHIRAEIYHLKAGGEGELEQAGRRHREDRGGAEGRARDHRRHVHLHRRLHRPRRRDAAVGAGGRLQGVGEAAPGSEESASACGRR